MRLIYLYTFRFMREYKYAHSQQKSRDIYEKLDGNGIYCFVCAKSGFKRYHLIVKALHMKVHF